MKNTYYEPPDCWKYDSIRIRYLSSMDKRQDSKLDFTIYDHLPEILRIKAVLQVISDRIKTNDPAAISLAVSFVVSPVFFHYSGYIRATMARRLKSKQLSALQKLEIIDGFRALVALKKNGPEFKEIKRLYLHVVGGT